MKGKNEQTSTNNTQQILTGYPLCARPGARLFLSPEWLPGLAGDSLAQPLPSLPALG